MSRSAKSTHLVIAVLCFGFAIFQQVNRIGYDPVKIWDEGSGSQNAIEMMESKSYIVVLHDGLPERRDVKPPLALWAKIVSYKVFGITEFAVRFPTTICAWLTMLMFVLFSWYYLKEPALGWIILFLIATTSGYMYYHVARTGDPDTMLVFFVTGYFLFYFIALEKFPDDYKSSLIVTGLFVVLAVYTKSVSGIAPVIGLAVYTFFIRSGRKLLLKPIFYFVIVGVILVILLYYLGREVLDPGYLKAVMEWELGLFKEYPGIPKHPEFSFYYSYLIQFGYKPWHIYIFISPLIVLLSKNERNKRVIVYSLICAVSYLIGSSSSLTKNEWYIAPIYPFLWLATSVSFLEFYYILKRWSPTKRYAIVITLCILFFTIYEGVENYIRIYNRNYNKPGAYIYEPERTGAYLKEVKTKYPELKEVVALCSHWPRQVKHYIKKYNYEDGTIVHLNPVLDSNLIGSKVILTDTIKDKSLHSNYELELIDSAKYGRMYMVVGLKEE